MKLTRLAVFFDGSYFKSGNIYFKYKENRGWLDIRVLHEVIEKHVNEVENSGGNLDPYSKGEESIAKVIDSNYYDGRLSTRAADLDQLEKERDYEMSLFESNVNTHFFPMVEIQKRRDDPDYGYRIYQKGVDIAISLDCLDGAHRNKFDTAVLFTGDEDFVPLVRKVESLGKRVLVVHYDFPDWDSNPGKTRSGASISRKLKSAASYTFNLNEFVSKPPRKEDLEGLFRSPRSSR